MAGKHVKALEGELGIELLKRTTRRLELTDAGRIYFERCKTILASIDDANREASEAAASAVGRLRVSAPLTFGAMYMGEVVSTYLAAQPRTSVDLVLGEDVDQAGVRPADVAVQIGESTSHEHVREVIATYEVIFCASSALLSRYGTPKSLIEISRMPKVRVKQPGTIGRIPLAEAEWESEWNETPGFRMTTNNEQMLLAATLAGAGVACGPLYLFGRDIARGRLVPLLCAERRPVVRIYASYTKAALETQLVKGFVNHLKRRFLESSWQ
jgi:DNA-binding transcriptional LysR family regulator